ncbi:MAG: hypothetical protein FWF84_05255, partial [Kiritimatiellaeota bacterium]|nr:hypothetical protein [Kiritimatiellota bacterium]
GGRIVIPPVGKPWVNIEIVGELEPLQHFGTVGDWPLSDHGTILRCKDASGMSVITACPNDNAEYETFSAVSVTIRNLDVRTYDNPGIGGIDLRRACQCRLENVIVNTDVYNVLASAPTHETCGIKTPACNNGAWTVLRNVVVTGYHTGILVEEHTDGSNVVVASNVHGLRLVFAYHASHFARVGAYRNTHNVTVEGAHAFSIAQLNTERPGPGQWSDRTAWQCAVTDVNDPDNRGLGDITYWVVVGAIGAQDIFTVKGGAGIRVRRIGDSGTNVERKA